MKLHNRIAQAILSRMYFLPDNLIIKAEFRNRMGYRMDLNHPVTFNEKLQWLKLYDRKEEYTRMVDKYEVKKYVSNIIGEQYIVPTLGLYERFNDIEFEKLPNKFVIKCTHDSGGLVICDDKNTFDLQAARKKINRCLSHNFYYKLREWPYKNVIPRIIIEKNLRDLDSDLKDYKFFVFNGRVECFKIDFDRFIKHGANYYDRNGKLLKFGEVVCPPNFKKRLNMPKNLNLMISLAEKLAGNTAFIRVDFYDVKGKIYFGELTFYPAAGFGRFDPEDWDKKLGDLIKLDVKNEH